MKDTFEKVSTLQKVLDPGELVYKCLVCKLGSFT